jgi:phosphoribosylformylglycinamidine synthase
MGLGLPSIGGKDSMSGTFQDIDVPPTLVSFAVDVADAHDVVTCELKSAGNKLVLTDIKSDGYHVVDFDDVRSQYENFSKDVKAGLIRSAYAVDGYGIAPALCKMAFGNGLGVKIEHSFDETKLFTPGYGFIISEVSGSDVGKLSGRYTVIGEVTDDGKISYGSTSVDLSEALETWKKPLEKVFPTRSYKDREALSDPLYDIKEKGRSLYVCRNRVAKPTVFIPVFPGTNCEYDSAKAFERAGADVITQVFANRNPKDIRDSVELFKKGIEKAQLVMFPGGFSAGDEPDGSAKFFATAFRNEVLADAVMDLVNSRDGLVLGICNGFQALIKLGLLPDGVITGQNENSPTLTYNTINRHVSKMAYTKVVSNLSPWLAGAKLGSTYVIPVSHGEGRFVANSDVLEKLFANGQVATRYCDPEGVVSMDEEYNINGSFAAIEGITSPDGRVFGKMGHSERRGDNVAVNIYGEQDMKIFESGVAYCR